MSVLGRTNQPSQNSSVHQKTTSLDTINQPQAATCLARPPTRVFGRPFGDTSISSAYICSSCTHTRRAHRPLFNPHFSTFTPLICSVVLYASNGKYPIAYIDALYNSVSAVTVCGLGTVNLSQLTPWQQVLLFIQMCVGSPVRNIHHENARKHGEIISTGRGVMVHGLHPEVRLRLPYPTAPCFQFIDGMYGRHFFAKKFEHVIQAQAARRAVRKTQTQPSESASASGRPTFSLRVTSLLRRRTGLSPVVEACVSQNGSPTSGGKEMHHKKLRTDMIRRMDAPPKRVNPSGWVSEGFAAPLRRFSSKIGSAGGQEKGQSTEQPSSPVRSEPPVNLTSSPIAVKDIHAPAGDPQTPLNA